MSFIEWKIKLLLFDCFQLQMIFFLHHSDSGIFIIFFFYEKNRLPCVIRDSLQL